jgi:hypothetical protein
MYHQWPLQHLHNLQILSRQGFHSMNNIFCSTGTQQNPPLTTSNLPFLIDHPRPILQPPPKTQSRLKLERELTPQHQFGAAVPA